MLYPIWGYLYDRYARAKLLALASFIWGATTWISAIAPTYRSFIVTRASTGIDDSAYPGLYSLVADYFGPSLRGKIYGLLQLAQPLGYLIGMIMALMIAPLIGGWRQAFYITGSLGLVVAVLIYFGVKEMPRGKAEPEFEGMEQIGQFHFSWKEAREIFKKKTMWFVFLQGFAGVFPWNVITFFFFGYLMSERGYDNDAVLLTMAPVIVILAGGYFLGGLLGDWLFKRTNKGRIIVSSVGRVAGRDLLIPGHEDAGARPDRFLHLDVPDGHLHAALLPERSGHGIRHYGAGSALHRAGRGVLRGEHRRCLRSDPGRAFLRALRQGQCHPVDLHARLGPVLPVLPGRDPDRGWRYSGPALPDGRSAPPNKGA